MASSTNFLRRDTPTQDDLNPTMVGLLIALLSLVLLGLASIVALLILRRVRQRREASQTLPLHKSSPSMSHLNTPANKKHGHRRTLTITSTPYAPPHVSYQDDEKTAFLADEKSPPGSPVPEIHITFPEEQGQKRGSRVVVVKITDNGGVGLEPYKGEDEQLPRYEQREGEWRSLDLERLGGLKEGKGDSEKRWG